MDLASRVTPGQTSVTTRSSDIPARPNITFAIWPSGSYHPAQADGAPRAESALGASPGLISITSIEAWEMAGARTATDRLRMVVRTVEG